jgi:hypothetical protein
MDLVLLLYGVAILRTFAWSRRLNTPISRGTKVAVVMVPVIAVLMWQFPYRLMYQSAFERVDVDGLRCYALGRNSSNVLLHCPDSEPPRNRVVSIADTRLHHRGVFESMFLPASLSQPTR